MLGNKIWGQKKIVFLENHCRILSQLGEGRLVVPRNKIGHLGEGRSLEVDSETFLVAYAKLPLTPTSFLLGETQFCLVFTFYYLITFSGKGI